MKELGVEPGDIKGIEDITKLPFTTKEDLRDHYPFGLQAVPNEKVVRVQGTSGTTGKADGHGLYTKRCGYLGRMCGTLPYNGRINSGGPDPCLLWIRLIHRRARPQRRLP